MRSLGRYSPPPNPFDLPHNCSKLNSIQNDGFSIENFECDDIFIVDFKCLIQKQYFTPY